MANSENQAGAGTPQREAVQAGHHDYPSPPQAGQHLEKPGFEAAIEQNPQFMVRQFVADTAMHRPAQQEELSPSYVFLAAPCCASYISGIVLPVTGSVGD